MNCTVCLNTTTGNTGGIWNYRGTVINSIAWGNAYNDIACYAEDPGSVTFSCYEKSANITGNDNIQQNPLVVNASGELYSMDWHLQNGSPCIDAGTPEEAPQSDIDGITRPQGPGIDMGAYEFTQDCQSIFYAEKNFGLPDLSV